MKSLGVNDRILYPWYIFGGPVITSHVVATSIHPPEHCSPLEQAATDAEHLQMLLAESQYGAVEEPTHVAAVPHLQVPDWQVSPELLHAAAVPHLHVPLSQVSVVPLHASTVDEHLHTLFAASQYAPDVAPTQVDAVPHLHAPD